MIKDITFFFKVPAIKWSKIRRISNTHCQSSGLLEDSLHISWRAHVWSSWLICQNLMWCSNEGQFSMQACTNTDIGHTPSVQIPIILKYILPKTASWHLQL
jgi:hypothetical protein